MLLADSIISKSIHPMTVSNRMNAQSGKDVLHLVVDALQICTDIILQLF